MLREVPRSVARRIPPAPCYSHARHTAGRLVVKMTPAIGRGVVIRVTPAIVRGVDVRVKPAIIICAELLAM